MNKKYKVEVKTERSGKDTYLSVTHNGCHWTSIYIKNPVAEIPLIISALQRHLTNAMHSDGESRVVLEKSSIPGDEETFNNGHGW